MEISMDPLSKNILELVSMLEGAVHGNFHRSTLLVKNFWISLNITGYMEISMDPFSKTFLNNISLNVTGYREISMDPFGKEFLI